MRKLSLAILVVTIPVVTLPAAALDTSEALALVAMPLAVNAVSELSGVATEDLMTLVYALNEARVAPTRFVEIVRYAPVALLEPESSTPFLQLVQSQLRSGATGDDVAVAVARSLSDLGATTIRVEAPPVVTTTHIVPDIVVERSKAHPHGGPPGQIKKEIGVQTGAEVVHGDKPGRSGKTDAKREDHDRENDKAAPPGKAKKNDHDPDDHRGKGTSGKAKGKRKDNR